MRMRIVLLIAISTCIFYYADAKTSIVIHDVPHIQQKPDFCGEACVAMYLQKLGIKIDQNEVFNQSPTKAVLGRGCYTPELFAAICNIGFSAKAKVWNKIPGPQFQRGINKQWQLLYRDLQRGIPSIVCMHYSDHPKTTEHFRLVLGYDSQKDLVIYHEPATVNGAYVKMKRELFLKLWPLKYSKEHWTIIRIPLSIDIKKIKRVRKSYTFTRADYAQHIRKTKKQLPHKNFSIVIEPPFVIFGDEHHLMVKRRATHTIRWCINLLKRDFFSEDPDHIINIWLFKDRKSYQENTQKLFGKKPRAFFGYYSYEDKALVMNISTGGGTLVHEIVHPFIAANFPNCPSWFNEGLASLYEQCNEKDGQINGLTNWRLKGLKIAIRNNEVPSFKTLTSTSRYEFYNEDPGTNYSQARYLCYYLQEKKLLRAYFHTFKKNRDADPTGYKTLQKVLGTKDMQKFKLKWQKFVLGLKF